jgi:hypothetical protein
LIPHTFSLHLPLPCPGSTLLAVITLTDSHPTCTFSFRIYVTGWHSLCFGLLTPEDGIDTLSRNVGKQLPHEAA